MTNHANLKELEAKVYANAKASQPTEDYGFFQSCKIYKIEPIANSDNEHAYIWGKHGDKWASEVNVSKGVWQVGDKAIYYGKVGVLIENKETIAFEFEIDALDRDRKNGQIPIAEIKEKLIQDIETRFMDNKIFLEEYDDNGIIVNAIYDIYEYFKIKINLAEMNHIRPSITVPMVSLTNKEKYDLISILSKTVIRLLVLKFNRHQLEYMNHYYIFSVIYGNDNKVSFMCVPKGSLKDAGDKFATYLCANCKITYSEIYECGGCGNAMYCSNDCAIKDWHREHRTKCGNDEIGVP